MSKKEKKQRRNNLADQAVYDAYKESIPLEEAWTWQVEGLQPPHVNKPYKNAKLKKIVTVAVLVAAISLSIYFSFMILHTDPFKYKTTDGGGCELIRFSNPGDLTELAVDYAVTDMKTDVRTYTDDEGQQRRETSYTLTRDDGTPITALHEYAFNCDSQLRVITIGKTVTSIDNKSFYSCYALKEIRVDPENPNYCDVDGVLFNKDQTELICYPIDHDAYLREKYGYTEQYWPTENWKKQNLDKYNENYTPEYEAQVNTYIVPETVKVIGDLAFNYSELFHVYLPEGLERLETMAFFRNWHLEQIDTYEGTFADAAKSGPDAKSPNIKSSLPDSLTYIGSDCFNSAIEMDYIYIPANVTYIGHHAFWAAARNEKDDETGKRKLTGLYEIHAALDEATFKEKVEAGDQWRGEYDNGLFPKKSAVVYGEARR